MDTQLRKHEQGRGRHADAPSEMTSKAWKDILWRTWGEISDDRITLIAAGATYYLLLALFPTVVAFVSLYGLFTDASTVNQHVALLAGIVPAGGIQIIDEQLTRLTQQGPAALGWGLVISVALALWSSSSGVKTLFEAMNIAYDEREKRSFLKLNALALLFTLGGLVAAIVMIGVVILMPAVLGALGLSRGFEWLAQGLGYGLVLILLFIGVAALYRLGPSRQQAKWRWLTPGAIMAVAVIIAASLLFSWYSANFANYEKTYGSLGALIGFLTWMWISVMVVLVGAELNAEIEHQTAEDSTVGADSPMGSRHATMADTIGKSTAQGGDTSDQEMTPEWRAGYAAAKDENRRPRRPLSTGGLLLALPIATLLAMRSRPRSHK
ncbi:YihY/virulence factor BrkB family protein [Devosia sp. Root413D1]|uniref:YihY/virulence factor BrkB family protein n=1 Tax=Devosia sp. Root413D1 TaxID=1736531 RepID=UPI0009EA0B2D|nr:YihY/virulence factor BrkB family protein [Devosia sp. Root413D1]